MKENFFTRGGLLRTLFWHGLIGAVLGYTVLHPLSIIIFDWTLPEHVISPMGLHSVIEYNHLWMGSYFGAIGAFFGLLNGLYRYRLMMLYRKVEQISITDPLTGLYNRRLLMKSLFWEHARSRRYHTDLSLMMIDIDFFKQFNDTHGHPAGDELLRIFAGRLKQIARQTDVVARYGGEEFVILMPGTDIEMAAHSAERLRRDIEAYPFANRETQPGGRLTVSIGCAQIAFDAEMDADQLLQSADDCLYRAKRDGRNQICY